MGEYTGLVLFLWIAIAPLIGIVLLSRSKPRRYSWEVAYGPAPAPHQDETR